MKGGTQQIVLSDSTNDLPSVTSIGSSRELDGSFANGIRLLFFLCRAIIVWLDDGAVLDLRIFPFQRVDNAHLDDCLPGLDLSFQLLQDHSSLAAGRGHDFSQDCHISSSRQNGRRPNEDTWIAFFGHFGRRRSGHFKRRNLRSKIISAYQNVHSPNQCLSILDDGARPDAAFCQQNHSGASSPGRFAILNKFSEGLPHVLSTVCCCGSDQPHSRRFSSGKDHSVEGFFLHVRNRSDLLGSTTRGFQASLVLFKGPLDGQYSNEGFLRLCNSIRHCLYMCKGLFGLVV
mmetsp:Transcript_21400/g.53045  ORF Transcript_21400/g.53045 Transcript_21400/m.53045 type:complete len:288 (+) Transcript_21400:3290-4153(+)